MLGAVTFVIFGAVLLGPALGDLTAPIVVYAILSLTVIRMAPVALALAGTGARRQTVAFLGWFGPRGLASIVFALMLEEDGGLPTRRRSCAPSSSPSASRCCSTDCPRRRSRTATPVGSSPTRRVASQRSRAVGGRPPADAPNYRFTRVIDAGRPMYGTGASLASAFVERTGT